MVLCPNAVLFFACFGYSAVVGLAGEVVTDNLAARGARDAACSGVLDRCDGREKRGVDGRIFEREVGIRGERAVLEDEVFAVTERLCAAYTTTHEAEIFCVPAEIFATDFGVVDGAVAALPERVFGVKKSVVNLNALGVLEGVFAVQRKTVNALVSGVEERIFGIIHTDVGEFAVAAEPERFGSVLDAHVGQFNAGEFPQGFRGVDAAVVQTDVATIPQRRAVGFREPASGAQHVFTLPEHILSVEDAVLGFDVT